MPMKNVMSNDSKLGLHNRLKFLSLTNMNLPFVSAMVIHF